MLPAQPFLRHRSHMHLPTQYAAMRQAAFRQLAQGAVELDPLIDSAEDFRRGITLLARPPARITKAVEAIVADFQALEPAQYYYPASDIHLTILSIISCYSGFTLDMIAPADYQQAVGAIVQQTSPFTITYSGLTASASGIMVQGVPQTDGLEKLRNQLRAGFGELGLQQSIDQRYRIQTAHSTVIRFRRKLQNADALIEKIKKYEAYFIGSFEVDTIELVYNDWYQRADNTVLLARYALGKP